MSDDTDTACACEREEHPRVIDNPAGRDTLVRRVGDFTSFRRALLVARDGEQALAAWRPSAGEDLALQMVEWFAVLADILTLYDQQIASECYLRTAALDESARRLVGLLGYRPRPGIGAEGLVGALLTGTAGVTVPAGFALQSKPGPGEEPQIFEVDEETLVSSPAAVDADPPADETLDPTDLLLEGTVTSVKVGDLLLLVPRSWSGGDGWAALKVSAVATEKDPRGTAMTRVTSTTRADTVPDGAVVGDYRLMRPTLSAHPWLYLDADDAVTTTRLHLESTARNLRIGDPVLLEWTGSGILSGAGGGMMARSTSRSRTSRSRSSARTSSARTSTSSRTTMTSGSWGLSGLFDLDASWMAPGGIARAADAFATSGVAAIQVDGYSETIWYANGDEDDPAADPSSTTTAGIAILHAVISFSTEDALADVDPAKVTVHHGFTEVATLRSAPATTITPDVTALTAAAGGAFPIAIGQSVLVEDAAGAGAAATLDSDDGVSADLAWAEGASFTLTAPLRVLFGVLGVSRGKTVAGEVLGSGDPTVAGQELTLAKSPLTYLASTNPDDPGYRSTLVVRVDGLAWDEVSSFYGQAADARVYVLAEDDDGITHVQFGDGVNGARLPAGSGNVIADYRIGSGAAVPAAGALTNVLKPVSGLRGVRSPVSPGGGANPEEAASLRTYAPRSVLTFERAVSADDYEALAAQAPGVTRAHAAFVWDAGQQRAVVKVYVGDDAAAVTSARSWLRAYADPNRPPVVEAATAIAPVLTLAVQVGEGYDPATVGAAVIAALLDDDDGLFAPSRRRIGDPLYDSEIHAACLAVEGAVAVHGLSFDDGTAATGPRHDPGPGGFHQLLAENLVVTAEASVHG